jgi:O-antigen/teichoic acid export membrane protein
MAYMMVAFTGAAEALALSATPKLANYLAAGQMTQFRRLLSRLVAFVLCLGVSTVLIAHWFGDRLLAMLYMPEYAKHADVLVWLTVAASGLGIANILSAGVTAARQFTVQVPVYGAVALTSAVGCYFLVPVAGMRGAAMAMGIGGLVHIVLASALLAWVMLGRRHVERVGCFDGKTAPVMES